MLGTEHYRNLLSADSFRKGMLLACLSQPWLLGLGSPRGPSRLCYYWTLEPGRKAGKKSGPFQKWRVSQFLGGFAFFKG